MNGDSFQFDGSKNNTNHHHPSGLRAHEDDANPPSLLSENGGSDEDAFLAVGVANNVNNDDAASAPDDAASAPEVLGVEKPAPEKVLQALSSFANQHLKGRLVIVENELRAQLEWVVEQKNTAELGWKLEEEDHLRTQTELEALKAAVLERIVPNADDTVETLREKLRDAYALLQSETDRFLYEKDKLGEQLYDLKSEKEEVEAKLDSKSKKVVECQRTESDLRHDITMLKEENLQLLSEVAELRSDKSE